MKQINLQLKCNHFVNPLAVKSGEIVFSFCKDGYIFDEYLLGIASSEENIQNGVYDVGCFGELLRKNLFRKRRILNGKKIYPKQNGFLQRKKQRKSFVFKKDSLYVRACCQLGCIFAAWDFTIFK